MSIFQLKRNKNKTANFWTAEEISDIRLRDFVLPNKHEKFRVMKNRGSKLNLSFIWFQKNYKKLRGNDPFSFLIKI